MDAIREEASRLSRLLENVLTFSEREKLRANPEQNLQIIPCDIGELIDEIPAVAPDRYVVIAVRDTGADQDEGALSRIYDPTPDTGDPGDVSNPRGRLTLSTIYRLLQICGGDLSVDVEQGLGSTFSVYLPRAKDISDTGRNADRPPTIHTALPLAH